MKLQKTENYSLFVDNHEQRQLKVAHIKKLEKSMRDHGFFPSKPLQVYKENGHHVVVDGHHRLMAARAAGVPVFYVVEDESAQDVMAIENELVAKWSTLDFVRMYSSRGNADYAAILHYVERGIPMGQAIGLLVRQSSGSNAAKIIPSGKFEVKTTEHAELVARFIEEHGKLNDVITKRPFIACICKCLYTPEFDFEVFEHRFRENPSMIKSSSREEDMMRQIEDVYNFRARNKVPLVFHVDQAMKRRSDVVEMRRESRKARAKKASK